MQRKASAVWQGGLKDGKGSISTDSGVLKQTQYSYSTRFETVWAQIPRSSSQPRTPVDLRWLFPPSWAERE